MKSVDAVWAAACDGEWHTLDDIAKRVHSSRGKVAGALDFLVKYGFARSSVLDQRRFMVSPNCPSPMEVAYGLSSLVGVGVCD